MKTYYLNIVSESNENLVANYDSMDSLHSKWRNDCRDFLENVWRDGLLLPKKELRKMAKCIKCGRYCNSESVKPLYEYHEKRAWWRSRLADLGMLHINVRHIVNENNLKYLHGEWEKN